MMTEQRIKTSSRECLIDITERVKTIIAKSGIDDGIAVVYCPHTTAGITINEGADPSVRSDIVRFLGDMIPRTYSFDHAEGNSDAHIKASIIGSSVNLLVQDGGIVLGTWQSIYFCEFDGPRSRKYLVKVTG
jgi:secondary thiamine-phosphate synthase enzyme